MTKRIEYVRSFDVPFRTNPESIKSRILSFFRRNFSPGGSREEKDAKEEAVLKSEKLNYIAVKNDARGFSVS